MLLRHLLLVEKSLTSGELAKHGGKYLDTLISLAKNKKPLPVDPSYRSRYGDTVTLSADSIQDLVNARNSDNISTALPKKITVKTSTGTQTATLGILFKGKEFTGAEGKKEYNSGHLAELFMGICVTAKFFNLGNEITTEQVLDMISFIDKEIEGKNYKFTITGNVQYPDVKNKQDTLNFLARIPARSAEAFIEQAESRKFNPDLDAIFSSAVKYVNESNSVITSCDLVRKDPNNNKIDVISDGTSDAKGTKADITLKIDGRKINLLSLKTYGSDTLGQFSGLSYENLKKWFNINFDFDITPFKDRFDPTLSVEELEKNLLEFYDDIVFPMVEEKVENQKPGEEAAIVKNFARAANIYARGETLEDVEIVKLDDKITAGSYKILRFSENLVDAMQHLDLEAKMIGKGQGRTIQIFVKPAAGEDSRGPVKLCQFRTQKTGGYMRNYFESGPMLEQLTMIGKSVTPPRPSRKAVATGQLRSVK